MADSSSKNQKIEEEALHFVVVGKVGKPYGLSGFCKIHSYTSPPENIFHYPLWHLNLKNQWHRIEVVQKNTLHDSFVAQFAHCHSPEAAKPYVNAIIGILRDSLPSLPQNEFYHHDLIGCQVIDKNNYEFGIVDEVLLIAEQDTLSIKGSREYLIPFSLTTYILSVDLKRRQIIVDWDPDF